MGELAAGALTFEQHEIDAVLLPIDDVVTVPRSTTPRQLEAVVAEHGFSRYPVRGEHGLVGFVHVKDVLDAGARDRPIADEHVTPFVEFSVGAALPEVLATMRREGTHLGRVVVEGRTTGLVALEDVLEQLIGDVRDAAVDRSARDQGAAATGAGAGAR